MSVLAPRRVSLGSLARSLGQDPYVRGASEVGGAAATAVGGIVSGLGEAMDPMQSARAEKDAAREATASHAASAATAARTDPASGTAQGASQPYTGTGTARTETVKTGGVTTGPPAGSLRISVPGRGMVDWDQNDPSIREAFAQQRGGRPDFMSHRERRAEAPPSADRRDPTTRVGPPGATGRPIETESAVPEAAQIRNWNEFLMGRQAEQQTFETGMAQSRAAESEATMRAEQPFMREQIAAKGQLATAAVKAEEMGAARQQIMRVVEGAAQQVNALKGDPRYQSLSPADKKAVEDQVWQQATLTLSALTRTNLYPRPDPYAALLGLGAQTQAPAPEGTS